MDEEQLAQLEIELQHMLSELEEVNELLEGGREALLAKKERIEYDIYSTREVLMDW